MAGPSPRERRMGQSLDEPLAGQTELGPETPEERTARQARNLQEWEAAYRLAQTPKQREALLNEREAGAGVDFPGTSRPATGFQPVPLEPGDAPTVQGFEPIQIPRAPDPFTENLRRRRERAIAEQQRRDLEPGTGVTRTPPIGFQESPGGAVTGLQLPRVGGEDAIPGAAAGRVASETIGAFLGGTAGGIAGATTRTPAGAAAGMRIGEAGGAFAGSLFAETFDPTEHPLRTAGEAAAFTAATGLVASGGAAAFRRMLGKPTEAGKKILEIMEKEGKVPPPGAVLPETSVAQTIQAIGGAEAFFGRSVKQHVEETGLSLTKDLKHYVADFYRYKKGSDKIFEEWDAVTKQLGHGFRRVEVNRDVFDALEIAVREWDRLGLTSQVDNNLLNAVGAFQTLKKDALHAGSATFPLTLSEAEAARAFLYNRARALSGSATAEKGSVGGEDFARAYRKMAEQVGKSMDDAIDAGVKDGKISAEARGKLTAGRQLWKQWKQGETILEELSIPLRAAGRAGEPISAQSIETALNNIQRMEEKLGRPVVASTQKAHLAGIMRAVRAVEKSGGSSAFTLAVRTGQLASLTAGVATGAALGGPLGVAGAVTMALSPAAFTFLVTNPKAASLLIRGLRLSPGAAGSARVTRELITLLAKEGFVDQERINEQ